MVLNAPQYEIVNDVGVDSLHTGRLVPIYPCLLYTSDAADERSSVDLGGRRIIKKKKNKITCEGAYTTNKEIIMI